MPVIHHSDLDDHLKKKGGGDLAPVYLIHGEELLYKRALAKILDHLLPGGSQDPGYDPVDGTDGRVAEALEKVNTYSLLSASKVVGLLDSTIFYTRVDLGAILAKVRADHQVDQLKKAAARLLAMMSRKELTFEDITPSNRAKTFGADAPQSGDDGWLDDVIGYCRENGLAVPPRSDGVKMLQAAVEKKFPRGNHLIVTTDRVDRRQGVYKELEASGVIVDCTVPAGSRKADKQAREAILREQTQSVVSAAGKKIDPAAFQAAAKLTGFNLRAFSGNLEKLVDYVGTRERITVDDVKAVLKRTRTDPLYEFTNAVTDRNLDAALFYVDSLLTGGTAGHPLQLLAAITNQIRRLLILKDFLASPFGRAWQTGCSYGMFQSRVMPEIKAFDQQLIDRISNWENELAGRAAGGGKSAPKPKSKKKKGAWGDDLRVAGPGKSPYPIYLMLKKAETFSKDQILAIMAHLQQTDRRLKTAAANPKTVLEDALFFICRKEEAQGGALRAGEKRLPGTMRYSPRQPIITSEP